MVPSSERLPFLECRLLPLSELAVKPPVCGPRVAEEPTPRLADMELAASREGGPEGGGGPGKGGRPGRVSSGASSGVLLEGVVAGTAYCESATTGTRTRQRAPSVGVGQRDWRSQRGAAVGLVIT